MANVIDGRMLAAEIETALLPRIEHIRTIRGYAPGLLSIVAGSDAASLMFVEIKEKHAKSIGINFERKAYPDQFDPIKVVRFIQEKNDDSQIDGIIVQLPLPPQFDRLSTLKAIHPYKDVDGLHPKNLGLLIEGKPYYNPPAVSAVKEILSRTETDLAGKHVVLVGAGLLVGKPLAHFFVDEGATVTLCTIHTPDLKMHTQTADIIVSSTGDAELITADMVKNGVVAFDFGGKKVEGKLSGEFAADVQNKAAVLTPVPGGIGPVVVAKLLENVVLSAERSLR